MSFQGAEKTGRPRGTKEHPSESRPSFMDCVSNL